MRLAHLKPHLLLRGGLIERRSLFRSGLLRNLGAFAQREDVDADLSASHPVVATRTAKRSAIFFPVSVGVHARAKVDFAAPSADACADCACSAVRSGRAFAAVASSFQGQFEGKCVAQSVATGCLEVRGPIASRNCAHANSRSPWAAINSSLRAATLTWADIRSDSTASPAFTWSSTEASSAAAVSCSCWATSISRCAYSTDWYASTTWIRSAGPPPWR